MNPLDRARLEKALADQGFDLTPELRGDWLVGRSTLHPFEAWVSIAENGAHGLGGNDTRLRNALLREGGDCRQGQPGLPGPAWQTDSPDYPTFHKTLGRFAALARSLPNQVAARFAKATSNMPTATEAERWVVQRIGQNLFREALIDYWEGRCAVTGLDVVSLLRASHIKPWAACASDEERLDVFNGLLLAPHLDALFDGGWISFSPEGGLLLSNCLCGATIARLGIDAGWQLSGLVDEHQDYLEYHRDRVFRG